MGRGHGSARLETFKNLIKHLPFLIQNICQRAPFLLGEAWLIGLDIFLKRPKAGRMAPFRPRKILPVMSPVLCRPHAAHPRFPSHYCPEPQAGAAGRRARRGLWTAVCQLPLWTITHQSVKTKTSVKPEPRESSLCFLPLSGNVFTGTHPVTIHCEQQRVTGETESTEKWKIESNRHESPTRD